MKRTYKKGILGAFIGGLIASLPWILAYVYEDKIYPMLALVISIGALKGYQLFKGKVDKKLPLIIVIISLFCVSFSTLILIPLFLLTRYGGSLSLLNLKLLYSDPTFVKPLMRDYIIAIICTIIGISATIMHIRTTLKQNPNKKNLEIPLGSGSKKDKEAVKKYFISRGAFTEETAIEIDKKAKIKAHSLAALIDYGIIIQKDNTYYYSKEGAAKVEETNKKSIKIIKVLSAIFGLICLLSLIPNNTPSAPEEGEPDYRVAKDISFDLSNDYIEQVDDTDEYSWYYFHKDDISGSKGAISISYFESVLTIDKETIKNIEKNLKDMKPGNKVKQSGTFKNSNNLSVIGFEVTADEYTDYVYYIQGVNKIGIVEIIDHNKIDSLLEDGKKIVDTFKWK